MEIRLIDEQPFIAIGKSVKTPAEVTSEARARIDEAQAELCQIAEAESAIQARLREALLAGEPTDQLRSELSDLYAEAREQRRNIASAESAIRSVSSLLVRWQAEQIELADAQNLAALIQPFDLVLKECQP